MSTNAFEIKAELISALAECIDPETGEIIDPERLLKAQISFKDKIDGLVLYAKEKRAKGELIKKTISDMEKRAKAFENEAKSLENLVKALLDGNTYESTIVKISYKTSHSIEITNKTAFDLFAMEHPEYLLETEIKPDKASIKLAIANGESIPGCELVTKRNMQIK